MGYALTGNFYFKNFSKRDGKFFLGKFFKKGLTNLLFGFIIDFVYMTWVGGRVVNGTRL